MAFSPQCIMFSTLPAPQRVVARYFAAMAASVALAALLFNFNLPGYGKTAWTVVVAGAELVAALAVATPEAIAHHFPFVTLSLGVLWSLHLVRRPPADGGVPFHAAVDWAGIAAILVVLVAFYGNLRVVLPAEGSAVNTLAVFAALSVLSWPTWVAVMQADTVEGVLEAVVLVATLIAAVCTGCQFHDTGPDPKHASGLAGLGIGALQLVMQAVSVAAAHAYCKALKQTCPPAAPAARTPSAGATPPSAGPQPDSQEAAAAKQAEEPAKAQGYRPLMLDETWEQRWQRQRALREIEKRTGSQ